MASPKEELAKNSFIESSIMKRVYRLEKKKTLLTISEYVILIGTFVILGFTTIVTLLTILQQREILDLFELFTQDKETINRYFFDTLNTIYIETPKEYVFLSAIFVICTIVVLILFTKRLPTLWHKLQSIRKFSSRYR